MLKSSNESVNFIAHHSIGLYVSIIGQNWHVVQECLNVDLYSNQTKTLLFNKRFEQFTPECHLLLELFDILEGRTLLSNFSNYDIRDMLDAVCTE